MPQFATGNIVQLHTPKRHTCDAFWADFGPDWTCRIGLVALCIYTGISHNYGEIWAILGGPSSPIRSRRKTSLAKDLPTLSPLGMCTCT